MPWDVLAEEGWHSGPSLRVRRYNEQTGVSSVVMPLTFVDVPDGHQMPEEAMLSGGLGGREIRSFLQAMMDAAYEMGLRPSRAQDERHLKAHLEDMRRFAFSTIKEKP